MMAMVAAMATLAGASARAQGSAGGQSAPPPARPQEAPSLGGFELTPVQKAKIDSIGARHLPEVKAIGDLFATDPAEGMKRMVVLRAKMQKEVRVLLTPDQRAIFDRNVAEMNAMLNARMSSGPP